MGIVLLPEVKMARRMIEKHSIEVPFDLDKLVKKYATIVYRSIPFEGIDGVCLHLKTAGKTPTVIVNSSAPRTRQKFTLAHELGHIIIPWHYGTFIDEVDNPTNSNNRYWELEREANRFASEVLMPFDWIYSLYKRNSNPHYLFSAIYAHCGVSEIAADIRLGNAISEIEQLLMPSEWILQLYKHHNDLAQTQLEIVRETGFSPKRVAEQMVKYMPDKISFCIENNGIVIGCGSSKNTHAFFQWEGEKFIKQPYKFFLTYSVCRLNGGNTHWWVLGQNIDIPDDSRDWREILEKIAVDILRGQNTNRFITTINAQLSGAFGNWKRKNPSLGITQFIEDSILRFNSPEYTDFIQHPDFFIFIKRRCEALFYPSKKAKRNS